MIQSKTKERKASHTCIFVYEVFGKLLIALVMVFFIELVDVVALQISLEELQPSDEMLMDSVSAREWCDKVLSIRQAVEVMMSAGMFRVNTEMNACYEDKAKILIGRCR